MKNKKNVIIGIVCLFTICTMQGEKMAIGFTGANIQNITYPVGGTTGTLKSITGWVNITSFVAGAGVIIEQEGTSLGTDEGFFVYTANTDSTFRFASITSSGATGTWSTPLTTGRHHFVVTYDAGSVSNDPIIYLDGTSVTVTENVTPTGSIASGSNSKYLLGDNSAGTGNIAFDGNILSIAIYNRILSTTEITEAYNSKLAIPTYRGLVFAPQLHSRGEVGEGGTLTASHTIADGVSGALGTPSGSPTYKGDAVLTYGG